METGASQKETLQICSGFSDKILPPAVLFLGSIGGDIRIMEGTLLSHEREKLINVIIFFANYTPFLGKTKLCKLLYFLDFGQF